MTWIEKDIDLEELFLKPEFLGKERSPKRSPSLKIVSGILGRCWIGCCQSPEISQLLGISPSTISFAMRNHLQPSGVIVIKPDLGGKRRFYNHLNFVPLIKFVLNYSDLVFSERDIRRLKTFILSYSQKVGTLFLEKYVLNETYEKGLWYVRNVYEKIPKLLIFFILSLYREVSETDPIFLRFLKGFHAGIMKKVETHYPKVGYVWIGFLSAIFKDNQSKISSIFSEC
ncbi:MAG: hypothetical protein ACFFC7_17145 [Candidatus Hermodarchaeota archaeon]